MSAEASLWQASASRQDVTAVVLAMTDSDRPYARRAIASVTNQTVRPDHVRVYVATDNAWIDEIAATLPGFEVRRIELAPAAHVRNLAAAQAQTTWVAYLDGDDLWEPRKQERQLALACQGAPFIGCDYYLTDDSGTMKVAAVCRNIPSASTWLVLRELMLNMPFDSGWRHEDAAWWEHHRAWRFAARVPEALSGYRIRANSQSSGTAGKRRKQQVLRWAAMPVLGPLVQLSTWLLHRLYTAADYPPPAAFRQAELG